MGGQVRDEMRKDQGGLKDQDRPVFQRREFDRSNNNRGGSAYQGGYDKQGSSNYPKKRNFKDRESDDEPKREDDLDELEQGQKRRKVYHSVPDRYIENETQNHYDRDMKQE